MSAVYRPDGTWPAFIYPKPLLFAEKRVILDILCGRYKAREGGKSFDGDEDGLPQLGKARP